MKKVVLVTGGTSGIGRAICNVLSNEGHVVFAGGRSVESGESSEGYESIQMNVNEDASVKSAIDWIIGKEGKIDVLVNNAGGLGGRSRFEYMTTEFYRFVMALNLDSTFFASRAAIPYLKKGEKASIINYTSIAGWNAGGPGAGIYGTSKAGVQAITRALAKDLAEYGIRVNAVSPGTIDEKILKALRGKIDLAGKVLGEEVRAWLV